MPLKLLTTMMLIGSLAITDVSQAEVTLAEGGRSDYQIILPQAGPSQIINDALMQVARLIRTAFMANGVDLPVVVEGEHDARQPGIYLGNTDRAKSLGVNVTTFSGWGYVIMVRDRDIIICGHDHPSPGDADGTGAAFARLGTAKAATDFLREYVGTRFLYPELPAWTQINGAHRIDLANDPAIEYLPMRRIAVPANLRIDHTPVLEFDFTYPYAASFYHISQNRFPVVDVVEGVHSWDRAVPPAKYAESHPEYFALIAGKRYTTGGGAHAQYCISNAEVQRLMLEDVKNWLAKGYRAVGIGQPDGFRPCQCPSCHDLYGTGNDWNEKIWLFHRDLAEQVAADYPDRTILIASYIQTANPPKSFTRFPDNVAILLTGTNVEDLEPWQRHVVPRGFSSYLYNWTPNLTSRYTPMSTPTYVEEQLRRLIQYNIRSVQRDGNGGTLYGMEGPAYYVMGRMYDDPENNRAMPLFHEFCEAAYREAATPMIRFHEELFQDFHVYAHYLATRESGWVSRNMQGRPRKTLEDPFRMLGFLWSPRLMQSLDTHLRQAESLATSSKVQARLALVRRELDYNMALARAIHLHDAYQLNPDVQLRNMLLDALDERNAQIDSYYRGQHVTPIPGWSQTLFPPPGHNQLHLRLAYNLYQQPFADTFLNWDTNLMRSVAAPGTAKADVKPASLADAVTIDSAIWQDVETHSLVREGNDGLTPGQRPQRMTQIQMFHDHQNLYLRFESELPVNISPQAQLGNNVDLANAESVDVYLQPNPSGNRYYRFRGGANSDSRWDAAAGLIEDAMDPRYGMDDPDWSGNWSYTARVDSQAGRWVALIGIPFQTLGVEPPTPGTTWLANFGRTHVANGSIERSLWSATPATTGMDHRPSFGTLTFISAEEAADAGIHPATRWRLNYYKDTFRMPARWADLPANQRLDLSGTWQFRSDVLDEGKAAGWFSSETFQKEDWGTVQVPSFWAEHPHIGNLEGYAWHRTTFSIPPQWKGRPLQLCFGSVDEQAWIYLNGTLIGEHTEVSTGLHYAQLWEASFSVDIPEAALHKDEDNVLIIRVHNAEAHGGVWRPVWLVIKSDD